MPDDIEFDMMQAVFCPLETHLLLGLVQLGMLELIIDTTGESHIVTHDQLCEHLQKFDGGVLVSIMHKLGLSEWAAQMEAAAVLQARGMTRQ